MQRLRVNMLFGERIRRFYKEEQQKMDDTSKTNVQSTTIPSDILNLNGSDMQQNLSQQTSNDATDGLRHYKLRKSYRMITQAYGASICIVGMIIPVIASLITVGVYLILPNSNSQWQILLIGGVTAAILWLLIAIPFTGFCTAQAANPHTYSILRIRLHQLKMSLGLVDYDDGSYDEIDSLETVMQKGGFDKNSRHQWDVVKEAYACCIELSRKLFQFPAGLQWYSGSGYTSAWRVLHHAEEVMIEVTDDSTVVREAKNDFRSLQGSKVSGKDKLLNDVKNAVSVLKPEASIYFEDCPPDKNSNTRNQSTQQGDESSVSDLASSTSNKNVTNVEVQCETAKLTLREVRRALNEFRDDRWEGLMRQRNRLFKTIAVTGIVTYVLLCVIILAFNSINIKPAIGAATIIYMVGAIAGLFVRFYAESRSDRSIDDFGLSTTRLVAIPLLSGLAGIGGVLISEILASLASNTEISNLFILQPRVLLIAAVFGATPNLFIKSLQNQAHEYEADLQSSKAAEITAEDS